MAGLYAPDGGVNRQIKKLYTNVGGVNWELKELYASAGGVNRKIFSAAITWTSSKRSWTTAPSSINNTVQSIDVQLPSVADKTYTYGYDYNFTVPLELPVGSTIEISSWLQQTQGGYHSFYVYFDDIVFDSVYVSSSDNPSLKSSTKTISTLRTVSKVSCKITKNTSEFDYVKASGTVTFHINGKSFKLNGTNTSDNQ